MLQEQLHALQAENAALRAQLTQQASSLHQQAMQEVRACSISQCGNVALCLWHDHGLLYHRLACVAIHFASVSCTTQHCQQQCAALVLHLVRKLQLLSGHVGRLCVLYTHMLAPAGIVLY